MNAIILLAGIGSRASIITEGMPKCLLKINNKSILERTINNFEIVDPNIKKCFVLGYKFDLIREFLSNKDVFVINPFYKVTNSIASLWFAREYLKDDVIIMNGDVCFSDTILRKITDAQNGNYILIDSSKPSLDPVFNSTTVKNWTGEYAGIYRLTKTNALKLKKQVEECVLTEKYSYYHESALLKLLKNGLQIEKIDIAGNKWAEIDTKEDFEKAKDIFC